VIRGGIRNLEGINFGQMAENAPGQSQEKKNDIEVHEESGRRNKEKGRKSGGPSALDAF